MANETAETRRLAGISVVLVEPQGPLNVGSVCRAMMNFGFSDLRLVNPCADYRSLDARRMALAAESILEATSIFPTLEAALADCHLAFGTTRRFGKYRENCIFPDQCARRALAQPTDSRVALVFGREDCGLHTSELDLCQDFVTIATDAAYPSMNLSHAVSLVLYAIRQQSLEAIATTEESGATAAAKDVESMFQHMRRTLVEVEYLDPQNPDHILRAFRRLFGRTGLSQREVRILQGLWSRIDWIENERRKLAGGP